MVSKNFDVASEIQNMRDATNSLLERSRADRETIAKVVADVEKPHAAAQDGTHHPAGDDVKR
jgi:hypothetical protein